MTVKEIYCKAMTLLGYVNSSGEISGEQELKRQGIAAVDQVYAELFFALGREGFKNVNSSSDIVDLPERILLDVMPYGVAMFIAQSENDGDLQQLFAYVYNKKRASIRADRSVLDLMPKGSDF